MVQEKDFLIEKLKQSGIKSKVYTSMKDLKLANATHLGAVLRHGETYTRSGSKRTYKEQDGTRNRRMKLFDRETVFRIIIADPDEANCERILTNFLSIVGSGLAVDGNWIHLEIGKADWVEAGDSILRSKIAVELEVTFEGGIYQDRQLRQKGLNGIEFGKGQNE